VAIAAALLVLFAYATIAGFRYDVSSIGRSSVPFLTVADHYLGGAAVLAWIAGIVSVLATLVAGADSQSRMLFDGGRTGLLPAKLGQVHSRHRDAAEHDLDAWNLLHLRRILAACERHHNDHRPHMALSSAAPLKPLPAEVTDLEAFRVRRRDRVGGVIHEYQHAA
jgi:hypothetical protein